MEGLKVLVIDDEESIVKSFVHYFLKKGYDIRGLTSGEEALIALAEQNYDVVITDLHMSHVTGFEIIDVVRLRQPKALLMAMSGKYAKNDVADLKVDCFFEKPFFFKDIEAAIKERLVQSGAA